MTVVINRPTEDEALYLLVGGQRFYTEAGHAAIEYLRKGTYFLVVNGGGKGSNSEDDRAVCRYCGRKERYLTRGCIPQPYRGLHAALYAYATVRGAATDHGIISGLPDLASTDPFTAHRIQPVQGEQDIVALAIGKAERIEPADAARFARLLKERGYPPPYIGE